MSNDPSADLGRTLVVVPTYGEAQNIEELLSRLLPVDPSLHVLVVDDGGDDTADLAEAVGRRTGRVDVLRRKRKSGLADAYRTGFRWGLEHGYDVLVGIDADLSHDPAVVTDLQAALAEGADLAIGSRYVPGGSTRGWSLFRRFLSRAGNWYAERLLHVHVKDMTSAYRAYRATTLQKIDLDALRADGYGFLMEMLVLVRRQDLAIAEVPIVFVDRTRGESKMTPRIAAESLLIVTRTGLQAQVTSRLGRR